MKQADLILKSGYIAYCTKQNLLECTDFLLSEQTIMSTKAAILSQIWLLKHIIKYLRFLIKKLQLEICTGSRRRLTLKDQD